MSRLRREHGMELSLSAFFDHPTLEALAAAATAAPPTHPGARPGGAGPRRRLAGRHPGRAGGALAGRRRGPAGRRGGRVTTFAAPARPHPLRKDRP
ncbi:MAG: phosphopantetheine-binding protein [Longimicrobiaceae bacterium]